MNGKSNTFYHKSLIIFGAFRGAGFEVSIDLAGMNQVGKLPDTNTLRPLCSLSIHQN